MMWLLVLVAALSVCLASWLFLARQSRYWSSRGLPAVKPQLFFGNILPLVLARSSPGRHFQELYRRLEGHPLGGFFVWWRPTLLVRDPALARSILVDHFDSFRNRAFTISDPLFQQIFFLHGDDRWKALRKTLEPAFGEKGSRHVFFLMDEMSERLCKVLQPTADRSGEVELHDAMENFVIDTVGTCALGIEFDSMLKSGKDVVRTAKEVFSFSFGKNFRKVMVLGFPGLSRVLGLSLINRSDADLYSWMVRDLIRYRREHNIRRQDLVELVLASRPVSNGERCPVTNYDESAELDAAHLTAQVLMLLILGREKLANALSFCLTELAASPQVQNKARLQVDAVLKKHSGQLSYEAVAEMTYVEMVVKETLRLYPPMTSLLRDCTSRHSFANVTSRGDGSLQVEPGETALYIPIYSFQRDARHFPEPDRFDPERFSDRQQGGHPPGAYLPFGDGPRACLGKHLAMVLMKTTVARLLSRFELRPSCTSSKQPAISRQHLIMKPRDGLRIRVSNRHWLPCE